MLTLRDTPVHFFDVGQLLMQLLETHKESSSILFHQS
jgi:hypothetical protein